MDLNDLMQMDHVIQVHPDGSVTEPDGIWGPEVTVETDKEGQYVPTRDDQGRMTGWNVSLNGHDDWTLLKGYAVDDGSELLHRSQYIGGALAEAILETPGYYVATMVGDDSDEPGDSWCVAFKEAPSEDEGAPMCLGRYRSEDGTKKFDVFFGYTTGQWFVKERGQEEERFFQTERDARRFAREATKK
jgi:hypothetical protein